MPDLALLGGQPVRTEPYPRWPVFDDAEVQSITKTVLSGRWGGSPFPGRTQLNFQRNSPSCWEGELRYP